MSERKLVVVGSDPSQAKFLGDNFPVGEGAIFNGRNFPGAVSNGAICLGAIFLVRIFLEGNFPGENLPVPRIPYDTFSDQISICHISLEIKSCVKSKYLSSIRVFPFFSSVFHCKKNKKNKKSPVTGNHKNQCWGAENMKA